MSVRELREKIDRLDEKIVGLLNSRAEIALRIGKLKRGASREIFVPAREKEVLRHVRRVNKGPLDNAAISSIYREIMLCSRSLEKGMCVAYFGPEATFTHQAVRARFGTSVRTVSRQTIGDVFGAVETGSADYGVVPIENSTEGAVTHTLDEFLATPLKICAEIYIPISHNLMSRVPQCKVTRILSHPQVFGQCRNWLAREMPRAELVSVASTARAAELAAKEKNSAAIAGAIAAEIYALNILASDIQDMSGNMTRFLVIGRTFGKSTGCDKSSLLFSVKHEVGALHGALGVFKRYGLNMTKIESRPSRLKAWEYFFFVDIEGHVDDAIVKKALCALRKHCAFTTVLGAYQRESEE